MVVWYYRVWYYVNNKIVGTSGESRTQFYFVYKREEREIHWLFTRSSIMSRVPSAIRKAVGIWFFAFLILMGTFKSR